eukprot:Polyplicarium_translucidae@DN3407_c7_g2_i3.p2
MRRRLPSPPPKLQIDCALALRGYYFLDVAVPGSDRERRIVVRTEPLPVVPNSADLAGVLLSGDAHTVLPELRSVHLVTPFGHGEGPRAPAAVLRQVTCPKLTTLICRWFPGMEDFVTLHQDTLKTVAVAGCSYEPPPSQWPIHRGQALMQSSITREFPFSLVDGALPWKHVACHVMQRGCQWRTPLFESIHHD